VIPYADFTYFVLLLYAAVPTLILGLLGRAGWRWALLATVAMLLVQYHEELHVRAHFPVREILDRPWLRCMAVADGACICRCRCARRLAVYGALAASLLPLAAAKLVPLVSPKSQFGFLGISYVTFRALDVVFCVSRPGNRCARHARSLDVPILLPDYFCRPIDRYRRFLTDWRKKRNAR